jgi:hypothetical protein
MEIKKGRFIFKSEIAALWAALFLGHWRHYEQR